MKSTMEKILPIIVLLALMLHLISCRTVDKKIVLRTGDIIFTGTYVSDKETVSDAINEVTQTSEKTNYTHMGLVVVETSKVEVIHAAPTKGVCREPLDKFFENAGTADLYRFKPEYKIQFSSALEKADSLYGLPYDFLYMMDGENGFYCSSLIYTLFEDQDVFQLSPMTFIDPLSGEFHPLWVKYYEQFDVSIPEGELGCNPNGMVVSEAIEWVGEMLSVEK